MNRRDQEFQTIHSEGGLLPPDLLRRILDTSEKIPGTAPEAYGLPRGERINEAVTQSWNRLRRHWAEFREAAAALPEGEAGTGLTNDKWSVPLLRELGFGMLPTAPGPEIGGRTYAINRFYGPTPIHIIGCGLSLDRRAAGVRGAALVNPHGLVQEFLNRSDGHLWAILSNGLRLRILRDNQALSRQSYLEFDLETMFSGEVFSDFVLLWLAAHATRFAARDDGRPESCWLEEWTRLANEQGARALEALRGGVERALQVLGQGFVGHPRNTALREALRSGQLPPSDFHGQLLRVVYRLIFLFVTEDRQLEGVSLLHPAGGGAAAHTARERYAAHYSTARLRELASRIKGSRHGDLWQQFNLLVGALSGNERFEAARARLALPTLGSFLWSPESSPAVNAVSLTGADGAELMNVDFLDAIRHLAFVRQNRILRPVDYKNLGSEELGGVYESLLALTPQISGDGARFTFAEFAGNERKTSGSYYTPDSLVQCLLDSALDPVVNEAIKGKTGAEAEQAILNLKVCDPACGSGHFLVGAAHRLARHLARVRALAQGDSEPSPTLYQAALRDVIGHCIYGVDINPMAAELCKVSLWLEAIESGKPLTFLDHHIQVGNSLLGATPALLERGIPDDAFNPVESDDKEFCKKYKKRNKEQRDRGQQELFDEAGQPWQRIGNLGAAMLKLDRLDDGTAAGLLAKERAFAEHVKSAGYLFNKFLHDAWCAAFVWVKRKTEDRPYPITQQLLQRIERNPDECPPWIREEVERLAGQYQFFHWHLAFPDVFSTSGENLLDNSDNAFTVVLGNPPWDVHELRESEFFCASCSEFVTATTSAKRKDILTRIEREQPELWSEYQAKLAKLQRERHFISGSNRFIHSSKGSINLYKLMLETALNIVSTAGRVGLIIPSSFASDASSREHFLHLITSGRLAHVWDFENRKHLFPGVDSRYKFALVTIRGHGRSNQGKCDFVYWAQVAEDLADSDRHITLTQSLLKKLNPLSQTSPVFRSRRDFLLTLKIHQDIPILANIDGYDNWGFEQGVMLPTNELNAAQCSLKQLKGADREREEGYLQQKSTCFYPVYEGKMVSMYDHRSSRIILNPVNRVRKLQAESLTITEHEDPAILAQPSSWVPRELVVKRNPDGYTWHLVVKEITSATNERTVIAAVIPASGIANTLIWCKSMQPLSSVPALLANFNALMLDYVARQKVAGLHLRGQYLAQMPILPPSTYSKSLLRGNSGPILQGWIVAAVLELTFTAWDLASFARDCGYHGPPFRWDEERRFLLRCELDAAFFHLYLPGEASGAWRVARREDGCPCDETPEELAELKEHFPTPRDAVAYIMDTFPIVRRKDEAKHGEYRTKRVILEIYDAMQEAIATGRPYETRLDPPPADPRCCHPPREKRV